MQSPITVFDHINKRVITINPGPDYDRKLAELAAQATQATTAGAPPRAA